MTHAKLDVAAFGLTAIIALILTGAVGAAEMRLLDAVRGNDTRAVTALLKSGADPNTRDDIGATALMYAAAFAAPDCLRVLIDAGADVNASSKGGATALMWATGDTTKVRLLLDHGAEANARLKDGSTALVTAARRGNTEVMRLLLARGSGPKASVNEEAELLRIVYGEHPETRQILAAAGIELKDLAKSGAPSLANFSLANTVVIRELLDLGANPNPRGRFPIVAAAAFQGQLDTARLLMERGGNPNAKSQQDVTPLMMAAAAPRPDPAMVRLLIEKAADPGARDKAGRTALDWALMQGDTEVARVLRTAGATAIAPPLPPAAREKPRSARAAIEQALARLAPTSPVSYETRKCISCHNQILPLMAIKLGAARGITIGAAAAAHPVQSILEVWTGRREDLMLGREVGGGANELTYGLVALAEAGVPPNSATDAAMVNLASTQRADGSWVFLDTRPPQADNSRIPFTAMAIRGLDVYGPPGQRQDIRARTARAREFLRAASPVSTQDEAFKLLGFVWSRVPAAEISGQAKRLLALQRADGGWAQLPTMTSDAYATGQALYALQTSGMSPKSAAYKNGVAYLLRTQLEDGTWLVRSRAFGFQPYFESGFPHGTDQFISASATSWAAIALAYAL
ncbi:MAG TPA: ankyrin repeat domain-containing protein [Terriglobales bacterium]|nr:ankyrin repeat domain-containing protein [Terriglobales bacterium]